MENTSTTSDLGALYLAEAILVAQRYQQLADSAIAQLNDEQFFAVPDAESNSVAIVAKHMAGNLRSRFTDFLTTDGEKADRIAIRSLSWRRTLAAKRSCVPGTKGGQCCSRRFKAFGRKT